MLLSMTGYGEARREEGELVISVELRSVNNRYLKINTRYSDGYGSLEPLVENTIREQVQRGSVNVQLRIERRASADDCLINRELLTSYWQQLQQLHQELHISDTVSLEAVLGLPGVVESSPRVADAAKVWPQVEATLQEALSSHTSMRETEGTAMASDMTDNLDQITANVEKILVRAPLVADDYRNRISERLTQVLAEKDVKFEATDIIREVSIFAERSDISEEIVRLKSHLDQFRKTMDLKQSSGRKLDFITQEMFRETNTIGSKANDVEISQHVIEVKASTERIREMVQNVE